jgi:hypothetical protein
MGHIGKPVWVPQGIAGGELCGFRQPKKENYENPKKFKTFQNYRKLRRESNFILAVKI